MEKICLVSIDNERFLSFIHSFVHSFCYFGFYFNFFVLVVCLIEIDTSQDTYRLH